MLVYMGLGLVTGLLAGMLGIGGGSVIVPGLFLVFTNQSLAPGLAMRLAIGTSLGSVLFTSLVATRAQHKRGAIDWPVATTLGLAALLGSLASGYLAGFLSGRVLKSAFGVFLGFVGLQIMFGWRPAGHWRLPARPLLFAVGLLIGAVSALLGIGGGSLTVPFLTACRVEMRRAIAISATLGVPIAFFGAGGLIWSGLHHPGLPLGTVGYIDLPALAALTGVAVLVVPFGVGLAHRLPVAQLRRIFGGFLVVVAIQMITLS